MDVLTTPPLPLNEWLTIVDREYLAGFIPAGGASVKVVIVDDEAAGLVSAGLIGLGETHGMVTLPIDAGQTRVHMMHELFFAIARAVPWDGLLQRYLEELFDEHAYPWPRPGEAVLLPELAAAFEVAPNLLGRHVDQWLSADLWDDRRMAQDFRAAMLALCLSRLTPDGGAAAEPVLQWLRGEKVAASLLRSVDVSVRLSRVNARPMLASLCHFLRKAGAAGLLVVLDVRALSRTSVEDGWIRYSPASVMDAFEVLREIIDDAEQLPGLFVAVLGDAALATGDPKRALSSYAALQMRVWPDVRAGDRQNPVAPLVWLAA